MDKEPANDKNSPETTDARRRALIAGLIAAPAVITLMSRSVLAQALESSEATCASPTHYKERNCPTHEEGGTL